MTSHAQGQGFKMNASLHKVPATGFYQIAVTSELSAYARADNADIRIAARDKNYVPYIIRNYQEWPEMMQAHSPLKILTNESDNKQTIVTLEQSTEAWTYGISLMMATTSVERYAQISGSNNNTRWYIIDDHIMLQRADGYSKGSYWQNINFPGNKYKYYKLKIYNAHTDPLNITGAQAFHDSTYIKTKPWGVKNPTPNVTQKDSSNHISYITIRNSLPFFINEVTLDVSGPRFYDRHASIFVLPGDKDSSCIDYSVASGTITSGKPAVFTLPGQKAQAILIEIDNRDDSPLKITGASTQQQNQYLVVWLEKDKQYTLLAGDEQATAPQYDLSKFNDSIPAQLPTIGFGALSTVQIEATLATPKKGIDGKWLWPVIVAFVIILSLLTYKLMKDAKKNGTA